MNRNRRFILKFAFIVGLFVVLRSPFGFEGRIFSQETTDPAAESSEPAPEANAKLAEQDAPSSEVEDAIAEIIPSDNPHAPDARVKFDESSEKSAAKENGPKAEVETGAENGPKAEDENGAENGPKAEDAADVEKTVVTLPEKPAEKSSESPAPSGLAELDSERVLNVGFPEPQAVIKEMVEDVVAGITTRRINRYYDSWKRYAASVLAKTNRLSTGLELNNRCRLSWYDRLYREPITSVFYVEAFSRELYCDLASGAQGVARGIERGRIKMDLAPSTSGGPRFVPVDSPQRALLETKIALIQAANAHSRALAPLTPAEVKTVTSEAFTLFCAQTSVGHTVPSTARAKYLVDLMEKMDQSAIYDGIEALIPLTDSRFLAQLAKIDLNSLEPVKIGDQTCRRISSPAGTILIGGPEDNVWNLDAPEMANVACVIDLGGNDTYREGTCNPDRPVLAILDLGKGDDTFIGTKPGIQGGSVLGISLLYSEGGDNSYSARDIAQGATIGGAGILIDGGGNDRYLGFKRVQGAALCGVGILIDRGGNDDYHAALLAQGLGNPRGFGVLTDVSGDDHYYVGGFYEDSYPEHPGYDGWGQGIGSGIRGVACGGIGALLEGDGDDVYEFDYFGHGGGYWEAIGFARDFGGNDRRIGATLKAYNGGNRTQARWQRFSNGFGCHYALGFLFDDAGDDSYNGTIMGLGMAWDLSAGFLVDFDGNDVYEATGGLTQGTGAEGSLGFLFDYRGQDTYKGRNQGYAMGRVTYHQASDCGGNFSFVVDHGGQDEYGNGVSKNNMMSQRGTAAGFVIDRPTEQEVAEAAERGETIVVQKAVSSKASGGVYDASVEQVQSQLSENMNSRNSGNVGGGPFGGGPFGGASAGNGSGPGLWGGRWGGRR